MNNKLPPLRAPSARPAMHAAAHAQARKPLIGVILGASRQGRLSEVPAQWIHGLASRRDDLQVELMDVGSHPLPFFDAPLAPQPGSPSRAAIGRHWTALLERLDGFVVVVPGDDPLRIARPCDPAGPESRAFLHKPVGFVGYGKRAVMPNVHALRSLASALRMAPVNREVHLTIREVMSVWRMDLGFEDHPHLARCAQDMLDELSWWAYALRAARERAPAAHVPSASPALLHRARQFVHRWAHRPQAAAARPAGTLAEGA